MLGEWTTLSSDIWNTGWNGDIQSEWTESLLSYGSFAPRSARDFPFQLHPSRYGWSLWQMLVSWSPISFLLTIQWNLFFCFRLSNPNITVWMKETNITNATGIHTYYANRILDITRAINVTPIVWQDVWDENVPVGLHFRLLSSHVLSSV